MATCEWPIYHPPTYILTVEPPGEFHAMLLMTIQRSRGDATAIDRLVRRFAGRSGPRTGSARRRPTSTTTPGRSSSTAPWACSMQRRVVADRKAAFMTSANLIDAALDRNIELGVLIRNPALAASVTSHFRGLINREALRPLPATSRRT